MSETTNIFDDIKHLDDKGQEFWLARELAVALEYKEWRNFKPVIEKAIALCEQNATTKDNHFVLSTEMVKLGSDASRNVTSYRLSRYACLLIAMSMNNKKPMALNALNFQLSKKIG